MPPRSVSASLSLLLVGSVVDLPAQDAWDQVDREIRRLPPSAFENLPEPVRVDLERRGCTIPQVWSDSTPGNVTRGEFHLRGQSDWAVLCSVDRLSSILVYRNGLVDSVAELASSPDKSYLQGVGGARIGYSRGIAAVGAQFIRQAYERYGGTQPPPLDHAGSNDAFVGKGSVVWYWYRGRWLQLTGSD